jgi:peptidoglycan/LPS O-acetylase OafA/YrhL
VYLLCVDGERRLPPGYRGLSAFQSPHWTKYNEWSDVRFCWQAIGAVMAVGVISRSSSLQRPFESRPLQYLGKISYSLYLVHELVYRLWRNPLRALIWWRIRQEEYPGTEVALQDPVPFLIAWIGSGLTLAAVTICSADLFHRCVEQKCVSLARRVEKWINVDDTDQMQSPENAVGYASNIK